MTTMTHDEAPRVLKTSVGKKLLMAGSGVVLVGFIVAHEVGNLKIYLGASEINRYGEGLRTLAEPIFPRTFVLWAIRTVLIAAFVVHVVTSIQLSLQNRSARPQRYAHPGRVQADPAASTMRWGGLAILLFLFFHLAHFTWGWVHPGYTYVRGDVYHNMVKGFDVWWISGVYIAAMVALGLHIYHGAWSIFQTFGVNNRRWDRRIRQAATALAAFVVVGNVSIPVAVLAGAVK
jgi:succinate dehydrogenase / fumarate reductase cytochrome b subunit